LQELNNLKMAKAEQTAFSHWEKSFRLGSHSSIQQGPIDAGKARRLGEARQAFQRAISRQQMTSHLKLMLGTTQPIASCLEQDLEGAIEAYKSRYA